MKKNDLLKENDLGDGLYVFKLDKELFELKGNTLTERLKFAVKDFLNFPQKKHHTITTHNKKAK